MKYFSYDPLDVPAMQFHATKEAAKRHADKAMEDERKEAQEGWSEERLDNPICWGEISEIMTKTVDREPTDDECESGERYASDRVWDFELRKP